MSRDYPKAGPVTLRTNLAESPLSHALRSGDIRSDLVTLDFCGPKVANQGFKPMLRDGAYDAGELAIGTFLQAKVHRKPVSLLPAVVMGRPQHQYLLYNSRLGTLSPRDIEGRRVGTRIYTQTTGIWVRGILRHEYGVDLDRITWVCSDDPHLAEYRDPPEIERMPAGSKSIEDMLLDGELDMALLGTEMPNEPRVRPLIADPLAAAAAWCRKYATVPVNHFFVVDTRLAETRPDVVREIYRMLAESKRRAGLPGDGVDYHPFGVEANRKALSIFIQYSVEQQIIPRSIDADELFTDVAKALF
ncbi:MAG TPA: phosphate ABC transporter substrate-binding protein [Pseudorhodoplanes sp.]|nr:phosphate ABC transporter substrate-binding protein [Pseudorhodoplanes sp.]